MTSLFASIGVDMAREGLGPFTMAVVEAGVPTTVSRRHCDHVWTDVSGARVVARSRWGRVHLVTPSLAGGAVAVACENVRLIDDRTAVMDLLDETDGGLICPIAVQLEDHTALHVAGGGMARGQVVLSALAETVEPRPAAVPAQRPGPGEAAAALPPVTAGSGHPPHDLACGDLFHPGLVCDDLIRPGLARPGWTPSARARLQGTVRAAELRTNSLTGIPFHWLRLRVHPGVEIDLAAPVSALPAPPAPGGVVRARVVLTGRLDLQPGTLPRPRRRRLRAALAALRRPSTAP